MRTDRVRVALRQRGGLEAIDLGCAMARVWWRPLWLGWIALVLPFGVALVVTLRDHPYWALVLLWWLRPLMDRVPLHVLGRALFSEPTGLADTLRALPALARSGIGTSLTLQRLSPARTFLLPVLQLEGLRGGPRRERCRALSRRDLGASLGLLSMGAHANAALMAGLLLAIQLLVPDAVGWDFFDLLPFVGDAADDRSLVWLPVVYLLGISAVEPVLVAGGFALYLNRRVYLEGWDIDLLFREMARRRAPGRSAPARGARAAAVAALCLACLAPLPAEADPACAARDPASAGDCIESVLAGSDFGRMEEVSWWMPKRGERDSGAELPSLGWLPEFIARGIELTLWLGLAALLLVLLRWALRRLEAETLPTEEPPAPTSLFGLELDPRSLPDDVVAAARSCWARGAPVEALSLLYRGALVQLGGGVGLAIPPSATELECLGLVRRSQPSDRAGLFADLTHAWLGARYAARPPPADEFESLCRRFAPSFGAVEAPA